MRLLLSPSPARPKRAAFPWAKAVPVKSHPQKWFTRCTASTHWKKYAVWKDKTSYKFCFYNTPTRSQKSVYTHVFCANALKQKKAFGLKHQHDRRSFFWKRNMPSMTSRENALGFQILTSKCGDSAGRSANPRAN